MRLIKVYLVRQLLVIGFLIPLTTVSGQDNGFDFGKVLIQELDMKIYERDTAAVAVVLNEFGEAYFDLESLNKIIFQYHVKIKILKESGKGRANFEIPLSKRGTTRQEVARKIKASSFNKIGNSWKETVLQNKDVYTDNVNEYYSVVKFAVPGVQVGSVIEVSYETESPFTFNFVPWTFQDYIPKVKSEFWAKYPAYYDYSITLKGPLSLTKNTGEVIKECVGSGSVGYHTGPSADCSLFKYGMENIPAFKEDKYMTAPKNFISAINYELSKVTQQDGRVNKITSEWKDAELELKQHENFGVQIKRARNVMEDQVKAIKSLEADPLTVAKKIHDYIKNAYTWNGNFGEYTENGVKKAFDLKAGNIGDINLTLLGAFLEAGLYAEPILISTRANGLPIKIHPVLSDFNYVLVRVKIGEKYYFVDATSSLYPFGFVPERCLNGEGRALGETSAWIDIKPADKDKTVYEFKMSLDAAGKLVGNVTVTHSGYAALNQRSRFFNSPNKEDFVKSRTKDWTGMTVTNFQIENEGDVYKSFIERFDISFDDSGEPSSMIYFQPFIIDRLDKNPFNSTERSYPVDFGAPIEEVFLLTLEHPESYVPDEVPQNVALVMPAAGGKYLFSITKMSNKLSMSSLLNLNKSVYSPQEYYSLKEMYTRYIGAQQSVIVFKKK